jgi:DNA-binding HxlR family transcriptional regulator
LIIRDLAGGPRRFVELQRVLPGISTEQLRSRLNRMVADGMLTRKRYREVPPRVDYELTERARDLMPILGELARWGYEWAWGAPRAGELVDIGAIFRLAPGLIRAGSVNGTIELSVSDSRQGGARAFATVVLGGNAATIQEREAPEANAKIGGATSAWVKAFGPAADRSGLEISGDKRLAEHLLGELALSTGERAVAAA